MMAIVHLRPLRKTYKTEFRTGSGYQSLDERCIREIQDASGMIDGPHELHKMGTDDVRGFVLHPVTDVVEFQYRRRDQVDHRAADRW